MTVDCRFPGRMDRVVGMGGTRRTNILNALGLTLILFGTLTIGWWAELDFSKLGDGGYDGEQERGRFATICGSCTRPHLKTF